MDFIRPGWVVPPHVHAAMTTRNTSDEDLRALLPSEPAWLRQVHGIHVVDLDLPHGNWEGDAAITRQKATVCAIRVADCMPVLLAEEAGNAIGAAHAGWRGLCAGVIEDTIGAMRVPGEKLIAWLGPAIGPKAYEVGHEVRTAFLRRDAASEMAFSPSRPGHWLLDLYTVARQRLSSCGVERVFGGDYCTYTDARRFHSYRRDRTTARMAAFVWIS